MSLAFRGVVVDSGGVFHEVDAALRAWLHLGLPKGTTVTFDVPDESMRTQGRKNQFVNSFLYDVHQDPDRKASNWSGVRARDGGLVGRQPPIRYFQLCYLITAWAADPAVEHELLGATLATLALQDTVPVPYLTGSLREADQPVLVAVANPDVSAAPVEIWIALGIPARSSITLVLTAPLVPPLFTDLAAKPERVDLGTVDQRAPQPSEAVRGGASQGDRRTRRLR